MSTLNRAIFEIDAFSPAGAGTKLTRLLTDVFLNKIEMTNNTSLWEDAWLLPDVLRQPSGIWQNLMRGGQEEAFCYCGVPSGEFANENDHKVEIVKGMVLIVFLDKQFEVSKWRWCEPDNDCPGYPDDYKGRFEVKLWPQD